MFIRNLNDMKISNIYTCGETLGKFLISEGFPLLGRDGKKMKFADSERLQKVLNHLPTKLKILRRVGLING